MSALIRSRALRAVLALAVVIALPVLALAGVSDARAEVRAQGAERTAAAELRAAAAAKEDAVAAEEATAQEQAAEARAARNEQRQRLAALGLNEATIDAFLDEVTANTELVEFRRDRTTREVDRQATEIPQMEECVSVATQTLSTAFGRVTDPDRSVPDPSDLCVALLDAGA